MINNTALLLGSFIAMMSLEHADISNEIKSWKDYKIQWNKNYIDHDEEYMRRSIYVYNKLRIDSFNDQHSPDFQLSLNELADKSQLEVRQTNGFRWPVDKNTGNLKRIENSQEADSFLKSILDDDTPVPDAFDWRQISGRVSPVKNQGNCGSCWAFAATGCLEGQELGKYSQKRPHSNRSISLIELSEQNLVDCVSKDYGCNGGIMEDAFEFVKQENGIDDEDSYPYEARTNKCRFNPDKVAFNDKGAATLPSGDEEALKKVVARYGPVSVAIDASSLWFQFYRRGVYHNRFCKNKINELDHGVLVVGYGTDPKKGDFWIVKNSWGPHYGEKGYIRMSRNRNNNCGIATVPTIAIF